MDILSLSRLSSSAHLASDSPFVATSRKSALRAVLPPCRAGIQHSPSQSANAQILAATRKAAQAAGFVADSPKKHLQPVERVRLVTSLEDYHREFADARQTNELVVVEFTRQSLPNTALIQSTLEDIAKSSNDVIFLRVMTDLSDGLAETGRGLGVTQIPSYLFFRGGELVHERAGMHADVLREQVLYYGAPDYPVHQLDSPSDLDRLLEANEGPDGKLVVVQVTLNFCGPCVRVYPTVLQLSHKMAGDVVFARLFGEANEGTKKLLSSLKIVEVPTFLFYRNRELVGRYVGSSRGSLVGEVLRYQGVQVT